MQHRQLGRSGLFVSVIGIGSNQFGRAVDQAQTTKVIQTAIEQGINFIDTADTYTGTVSEQFIGQAIKGQRDKVIIATKTGFALGQGPNEQGLSRRRIFNSVEASLKRLDTDYIDVFYLHRPDPNTPIAESLRALEDLVRAGKIRYPACSNYSGWQIAELETLADCRGWVPAVVSQSLYNVLEREVERDVIPACKHFGMSLVPYSPLASGFLTGKYHPDEPIPTGVRGHNNPAWQERRLTEGNFKALEVLEGFASERGHSVSELAIAWLLAHPVICSVIAGVTRPEQVAENVAAAEWHLSDEDLREIDARLDRAGVLAQAVSR